MASWKSGMEKFMRMDRYDWLNSDKKIVAIETKLKKLGKVKRTGSSTLRIQSALSKDELKKEIRHQLNIELEDFDMIHVGDLYVLV